jgi:predicted phosphodiesterase
MRVLVISDIHANLTALETVLSDAGHFDAAWCLGDLVGYGPDPNECIARVRGLPNLKCIIGNHDAAVIQKIDAMNFNPEAKQAIRWTKRNLSDESLSFLHDLPKSTQLEEVTLAHGSPRQPVWEYLMDAQNATRSFDHFKTPYCFVGHTHLPVIYHLSDNRSIARLIVPEPNTAFSLSPRAILNPGSVGQPRDRDPRAAYAIFDSDEHTWEYRRIRYEISSVQERMKSARLPERHIQRLSAGW